MTEGDLNLDLKQQDQREEPRLPVLPALILFVLKWVVGPVLAVVAYLVVRWVGSVMLR